MPHFEQLTGDELLTHHDLFRLMHVPLLITDIGDVHLRQLLSQSLRGSRLFMLKRLVRQLLIRFISCKDLSPLKILGPSLYDRGVANMWVRCMLGAQILRDQ